MVNMFAKSDKEIKINRVHLLITVNMFAKCDKEIHNS